MYGTPPFSSIQLDDLLERRELALGDDRVGLDAEGEHVCIVLRPAALGIQLGGGDDEQLPGRPLDRPAPSGP